MKLWPVALFAATLTGSIALLPPGAPGAAAAATPAAAAASQCRAGEQVVYSCRFGKAVGSVCGDAAALHYRFGPAGQPGLDLVSRADWSNVHTGSVHGQGAGGYQEHIRFTSGATHYIVFRGQDGELADRPGRTYSGIAVQSGPNGERTLATLTCPGGARIADSLVDAANERSPADTDLSETPEGPFDAWF